MADKTTADDPRVEKLAQLMLPPFMQGQGYDWFKRRALADARRTIAIVDGLGEAADGQ